jgi:phosphoribosylformylglycinamidine cyclo-ligase
VFATVQRLGRVPRTDLERTLNQGVGFLVVLPADQADRAIAHAASEGIPAWVLGEVTTFDRATTAADLVSGAPGVDGGAVRVLGEHPDA